MNVPKHVTLRHRTDMDWSQDKDFTERSGTAQSQHTHFTERSGKRHWAHGQGPERTGKDWEGPERTGKDWNGRPASLPAGQPELGPSKNVFRLKIDTGDEF